MHCVSMQRAAALAFLLFQIQAALCVSIPNNVDKEVPSARSLVPNCDGILDPVCLKINFISFVEQISKPQEYEIMSGLTLVKQGNDDPKKETEKLQEISRAFPDDPKERVDSYLSYKIKSFLDSHTLQLKLNDDTTGRGILDYDDDDDDEDDDDDIEENDEGRKKKLKKKNKKKKKKGGLLKFVAVIGIVKTLIGAVFTKLVFLLAKKALLTSVIALGIAAFLAYSKSEEENTEASSYSIANRSGYAPGKYSQYQPPVNVELPEHLSRYES